MIRGSLVSAARHFADNFSVGRPANRRPLLLVRVVADCFQRESTHEPLAHVTVGDRSPEPDDLADEDVQQVVLEPEHERLGRGSPESSSRRGSLGPLTVSRERIHCPSLARTRSSSCRAYQLSASTLGASAVGLAKRFRPAGVLTSETVWLKWMRYAEGMVAALTPGRLDQSFSGRFLKVATHPSMAMAAGGGRGQILGDGNGFGLAFKADALWVGTHTKAVDGPGGRLAATDAAVNRLRTALEGSHTLTIGNRMALTPSVEVGIRQDGGDAETGTGMDVGAGLVFADAGTGLSVDVRVRRLVVHQANGFAEHGLSISVSYNPTPTTPLGFTARVSPAWGGDAMSGAEALWGRESMGGMGHESVRGSGGHRLDTEVGYGLPIGSRFVGTPRAGVRTSEYGRDYRIGYGVGVLEQGRLNLQIGVDAERRESSLVQMQEQGAGTDQHVLGRATVQW